MAGWTPGERNIYTALYKKAHGQSSSILKLTAADLMALADIKSRGTFQAAIKGLVRRGVIRAELIRGNRRTGQIKFAWEITLLDPATGIAYEDSAAEDLADPDAYKKSYDPLAAWDSGPLELPPAQARGKRQDLDSTEIKKYYLTRLPGIDFDSPSPWLSTNCRFHADETPSLSVHKNTGNFRCHGCHVTGNVFSFEMRVLGIDDFDPALKSVFSVVGRKALPSKPATKRLKNEVALYRYEDEQGVLLHELVRYRRPDREDTQYSARHRSADGRVWVYSATGVRRVLYNLRSVIAASTLLFSEGEKDSDSLASLGLVDMDGILVASTTNPFGAGNWRDEFSPFLKDKRVVIMGDNDKKGIAHIAAVCESIRPYAREVRTITLYPPALTKADKKDVSDFLNQRSLNELLEIINHSGEIVRSLH